MSERPFLSIVIPMYNEEKAAPASLVHLMARTNWKIFLSCWMLRVSWILPRL